MSNSRVALITGGSSGIGLAVASILSRQGWRVHILSPDDKTGPKAAAKLEHTTFHKADVLSWESLTLAFDVVFKAEGRLDFVFANAGIMDKGSFYGEHDASKPPPPLEDFAVDVNLQVHFQLQWRNQALIIILGDHQNQLSCGAVHAEKS